MIVKQLLVSALAAFALVTLAGAVASDADFQLVMPTTLIGIGFVLFLIRLKGPSSRAPFLDVGLFFSAALFLYSVVPSVGMLVTGSGLTGFADNRLSNKYQIGPEDVAPFIWRYFVLFAAFSVTYLRFRRSAASTELRPFIAGAKLWILAGILIVVYAYSVILELVFSINLSPNYADVSENLMRLSNIPLVVAQITNHLLQIGFVAKLAVMIALFTRFESRGVRNLLLGWLIIQIIAAIFERGSRSGLFLTLIAYLLLYHTYVRHFSLRQLTVVGACLIGGFLLIGFVRMDFDEVGSISALNVLTTTNEFQSLLGTVYDLYRMKEDEDLHVPVAIYFADLWRPIPQQFLPFEKPDQAEWYLSMIDAQGIGVGYSFGILSEAVIGFDWLELVMRGVAIGAIFAWIHNRYVRNPQSASLTLVYLWLCLKSYLIIRNSTFYLLAAFLYQVCTVLFVMRSRTPRLSRGDQYPRPYSREQANGS